MISLEPLEIRRLKFALTYYYKVSYNLTPFDPNRDFNIYTSSESSRSNASYS